MDFKIKGKSGSERDGLEIKVHSNKDHTGNDNSFFGAGIILVTDW